MSGREYIALFGSVTRVMKAEKVLKKEGVVFTLIPSPRTIPSPCGLAIRFEEAEKERIEKVLDERNIKMVHLYLKGKAGYEKIY